MNKYGSRFQRIFDCLCENDFESALTLICPLIDHAGKELFGIKKTGERFKKILQDNNGFLYWMMSGGVFDMGTGSDFIFSRKNTWDITLAESIYKLARNNLLHDAELDENIRFVDEAMFGPDGDKIIFPKNLVWALVFMCSYLPCYRNSRPESYKLLICDVIVPLEDIWGDKENIEAFFACTIFNNAHIPYRK